MVMQNFSANRRFILGTLAGGLQLPEDPNPVPRYQGPQTSTILARSAVALLEQASRDNLELALNTLGNKNIPAERLLYELDHGPFSYQQVLSELARGWQQQDIDGFAEKFGMPRDQLDVMDIIVSLGILNDPALESRLRAENQAPSTPTDFLSSRRVVWQSVEPGSVLNPPYVILIAVEAVDNAIPNDVAQSIIGQLGVFRNYKLPQAAVARLSGPPVFRAEPVILNPLVASMIASRFAPVALAPTTPPAVSPPPSNPPVPAPLPQEVSVKPFSPVRAADRQIMEG